LRVDNSVLTGETEPISCTTVSTNENYMETKNLLFLGTTITEGTGMGVVVATGGKTVMGFITTKTASSVASTSYMQKEINRFMILVCIVAGSVGATLLFLWAVWLRTSYPNFLNISQMITTCVGVIVGFLPDGLPVCITLTLTIIARKMFKNNILVKHLPTVENLGCVDVIASDKTGTLTQNKMSVVRALFNDEMFKLNDDNVAKGLFENKNKTFMELLHVASLCNQANFDNKAAPGTERRPIGNASDSALLVFSEKLWSVDQARKEHEKIAEVPFNSKNKWALSIHRIPGNNDKVLLLMKGATEYMINRSTTILSTEGEVTFPGELKKKMIESQESYAVQGERVLGFCKLEIDPKQYHMFDSEFNIDTVIDKLPLESLCFVGIITLIDPPRPEVPEVVV
jgi:sodium/potassium-transporting ATPase subunit alpha